MKRLTQICTIQILFSLSLAEYVCATVLLFCNAILCVKPTGLLAPEFCIHSNSLTQYTAYIKNSDLILNCFYYVNVKSLLWHS